METETYKRAKEILEKFDPETLTEIPVIADQDLFFCSHQPNKMVEKLQFVVPSDLGCKQEGHNY